MPLKMNRRSNSEKEDDFEAKKYKSFTTCSQKVIIFPDEMCNLDNLQTVTLRHPYWQLGSLFLMGTKNGLVRLAELNTFDEGNRSWFIGSSVVSDGKLHMATPFNPVYLILPYLMKADRNVPLDQLLKDDQFPLMSKLAECKLDLSSVADRKGSADLNVWKYNEDKTLTWLEKRCCKLAEELMERKQPTSTAQALTFVRIMSSELTIEAYMQLAYGILTEYVPEELALALRQRLKLPNHEVARRNKQKAVDDEASIKHTKKAKIDGPTEDYLDRTSATKKTVQPTSAKAKSLAKSAVGNKSITSFFSKK